MDGAYQFLKKVELFSNLPDEDLDRLCQMIDIVDLPQGAVLFQEGDLGDKAYIIKEGEIEIFKHSGDRYIQLAVRKPGEVIGEISMLESSPRSASGRARENSRLYTISHTVLGELLNTSPSAARVMLHTITSRLQSTELLLKQSEKMAQLGELTAGIAHELNNPAAAVRRGSAQLEEAVSRLAKAQLSLAKITFSETQTELLMEVESSIRGDKSPVSTLDPITRSDRSAEYEEWLEAQGIPDAWELAPLLVDMGVKKELLERLVSELPSNSIASVISWLGETYAIQGLLQEIGHGARQISEIVKALKGYSYLDQAPTQFVDIHEGLENTLVMLRHALKDGIHIKREYSPSLPKILAYASELNQVWTNLISNAIDAVDSHGDIILRTSHKAGCVVIEVEDNGSGIPEEIVDKIFSPFFTTKPVGKGNGLGLNITYKIIQKHRGDIKVISKPGQTRFEVWIPENFEKVEGDGNINTGNRRLTDDELRTILADQKVIAVVGMTDSPGRPSTSVPAYLSQQGYKVIPVNPTVSKVNGEKSYPDLLSIGEKVDLVLIFRRSEAVPEIVSQAIEIGAKVVWMQEGIINETAADEARSAGLAVVMDMCIRKTHIRLSNN